MARHVRSLAVLALFLAGPGAAAALAGRCPVRVGLVQGNAAQASRAPDGRLRGVAVDVAAAIARTWRRPVAFSTLAPAAILAALDRGELDLGFVAAGRGGPALYSRPYMLVQQTAMVADGSALRSVGALDRAGVRIGATRGDSIAAYVARQLPGATLLESGDVALGEAVTWLREGKIDAFAANRQRLAAAVRANPGLRLLPDNLTTVPQAVAVPSGQEPVLAAVEAAIVELQRSGALRRAIAASGVVGIEAAPRVPGAAGAAPPAGAAPACPR